MTKPKAIQAIEAKMRTFEDKMQKAQETLLDQQRLNQEAMQKEQRLYQQDMQKQIERNQQGMQKQIEQNHLSLQQQQDKLQKSMEFMMERLLGGRTQGEDLRSKPSESALSTAESHYLYDQPEENVRRHQSRGSRTFDYSKIQPIPDDAEYKDFRIWRKKWEANAKNKTMHVFSRDEQISAVMDAMGPCAAEIAETCCMIQPYDPDITVEIILDSLQGYYKNTQSKVVDRLNFEQRTQGEHETFGKFRCALKELAEIAEVCQHCRSEQIAVKIIQGTKDEEVRRKMMRFREIPSLEEAAQLCQAYETADKSSEKLNKKRKISKISTYKEYKRKERDRSSDSNSDKDQCSYCGGEYHHRDQCFAKDKTCQKCKKKGHFARMCITKETRGRNHSKYRDSSPPRDITTIIAANESLACKQKLKHLM